MLQALREKSSGWVATVILGLLIIPFALFGVNDYLSQSGGNHVVRIQTPPSWWRSAPAWWPASMLWTKVEIDANEFRQRFDMARNQARLEAGESFDSRAFESIENRRRVLEQMVDERLALMAADQAGLKVSDAQVRKAIEQVPAFQVDGVFNAQRYQGMLSGQGLSPQQFQEQVREDLLRQGLLSSIAGSAFVTPQSRNQTLALMMQTRDVSAVLLSPKADALPVSEDEIKAWYQKHAANYQAPQTVTLEYVEVEGSKLTPAAIDEAQLRARYDSERSKFGSAEQRLVSHILIPVPADADAAAQKAAQDKAAEIARQARAGADFAALAKANPGDPGSSEKGGDLGWIERDGGMVKPFEDAVFGLQANTISEPVRTDFGWHVIKLREVRASTIKPFEEVRAQLEKELQETANERAYNEQLSALIDDVMRNPSGFADVAAKHKLEVKRLGPVSEDNAEGILASPQVAREAFSETRIQNGQVSDPINISNDHSVLLRVVAHTPSRAQPLEEVKDRVIADIRADKARQALASTAQAMVADVRAGKSLESLAVANGTKVDVLPRLARATSPLGPDITRAVFALPVPEPGKPAIGEMALPNGAHLVYQVTAAHQADLDQLPEEAQRQEGTLMALGAGSADAEAYLQSLRKRARVDINESQL